MQILKHKPRDRSRINGISGRIIVTINTESYLHISSPFRGVSFDGFEIRCDYKLIDEISRKIVKDVNAFMRIGNKPAIPASSVKGNVRSRIELSFKPKNGKVRSCFIRSSHLLREPKKGEHGWRHYRIWKDSLSFDRRACDYTRDGEVCLVCDIFGTTGLQGLVFFSDFIGDCKLEIVELPHGEKVEVAPPGSSFVGEVIFRNLKPEEVGLLLFGMGIRDEKVGRPVLLGKYKYRYKFGIVRYEVKSIELKNLPSSVDEEVKKLVRLAMETFDDLADIDEVRKLEELETRI